MIVKIDQRKIRTRSRFRNALLILLRDYRFEEITLTKISKQAEVNRVTFYGHYRDKYELLDDVIEHTLTGLRESVIRTSKEAGIYVHPKEHLIMMAMLTYINDHSLFFQTMLSERRVPGFIPIFINCIEEIYHHVLLPCKNEIDFEIYRKFVTSATLGIISYWIKNDMKDLPDYLAQQLKDIQQESPLKVLLTNQIPEKKAENFPLVDRRVQRTKKYLKDALLFLISDKGYEAITITDICRKANYNRAAFYAHYKNKQELAAEMMEEKIQNMIQFMNTPIHNANTQHGNRKPDLIKQIFCYVASQKAFFRVMFSGRTVFGFLAQLRSHLETFVKRKIELYIKYNGVLSVNCEVLIDYITFVIIGMISHWVRSGMIRSPEYMAEQLTLILNQNSKDLDFY